MKIECPNCRLTGQISDAKIPAEGQYMDCPRCKTNFLVQRTAPASWADTLSDCPQCGYSTFSDERFDICPTCGLVAKTYNEQRRQRQPAPRPAPQKAGRAPEPAAIDSERIRQDLERLQREEEKRHQHLSNGVAPLPDKTAPEAVSVPAPVQYLGWAFAAAGLLALAWGMKDFFGYLAMKPADAVTSEYADPPGPFMLYLTYGLLPCLQILLGAYAAAVAFQFLKLRAWARKGLEAAAWGGLACAGGYELVMLVAWIRRSSSSATFWYYLVGVVSTLLMILLWCAPFLAAIWYLRGDAVDEAFGE